MNSLSPLKVIYTGAVKDLSGYAEAARGYIRSLDSVGIDVSVDPKSFEAQSSHLIEEVVERRIWAMTGKPRDAKVQIIHLTPDNYSEYTKNPRLKVGYYAWETSRLPLSWVGPVNEVCCEAWVPCQYLKDVSIRSGVTVPVNVVPHVIPLPDLDKVPPCTIEGLPTDRFKFYSIFQWCHDDKTRVLTQDGFKFFSEISKLDKLATFNLESEKLEYQRPTEIVEFNCSGHLIHSNSDYLDFSITEGHSLIIKSSNSKRWVNIKAGDLFGSDEISFFPYELPKQVLWTGVDKEEFHLPGMGAIPMKSFITFLGWYLAKGKVISDFSFPYVEINFSSSIKVSDLITHDIRSMGCDFFEVSKGKIKVYSKALCSYLSRFGNSSNRLIPASIKSLSPRLLKMLLDAFFYTKNISINDSNNHFRVGSKRLCEDILECLIKIGEWGSIAPDGSEWIINLHHNRTKLLASKLSMSRVPYDGKVYCASVPNKTLVTERNGKILISGNSERKNPKSLIQAYYNEFSFNDPVCLVLKTYRVGNARNERDYIRKQIARLKRSTKGINCPPIILIEDFLNIAEIDSIHHHCDCYVSMARSEGFGIPAFTAASFGNPVIVPNYSAFPEHFNESNGYLIDVTNEVPVTNMRHISLLYTGNMYWGDPSVDSLQSRMREVVNNQGLAKRKGLAARTYIGENLSYKAIGTFLKGYIERINRKAYYGE